MLIAHAFKAMIWLTQPNALKVIFYLLKKKLMIILQKIKIYNPGPIPITGCDILNCEQICTRYNDTSNAYCKCKNGYVLNADSRTCSGKL